MKKLDDLTKLDTVIDDGMHMYRIYWHHVKRTITIFRTFETFIIISTLKTWNLIAINQHGTATIHKYEKLDEINVVNVKL